MKLNEKQFLERINTYPGRITMLIEGRYYPIKMLASDLAMDELPQGGACVIQIIRRPGLSSLWVGHVSELMARVTFTDKKITKYLLVHKRSGRVQVGWFDTLSQAEQARLSLEARNDFRIATVSWEED